MLICVVGEIGFGLGDISPHLDFAEGLNLILRVPANYIATRAFTTNKKAKVTKTLKLPWRQPLDYNAMKSPRPASARRKAQDFEAEFRPAGVIVQTVRNYANAVESPRGLNITCDERLAA